MRALSFQISRQQSRQGISSFLRVPGPPSIRSCFLTITASSIQPIQEGIQHQSATCLLRGANCGPCRSQSGIQSHQRLGSTSEWSAYCHHMLGNSHILQHNLPWRKWLVSSHVSSVVRTISSTSPNDLLRSLAAPCAHFRSSLSPVSRNNVQILPNMCWILVLHRRNRSCLEDL